MIISCCLNPKKTLVAVHRVLIAIQIMVTTICLCSSSEKSLVITTKVEKITIRYPQLPFPEQPQTQPGLASDMQPMPDHGEKNYKGHGRQSDKKALITGGDSGIGRAVAIAYAREGANVAINYLPEEEEDAVEVIELIKAEGRIAVALPGDVRDETFCQNLVEEAIAKLGDWIF